MASSAAVLDEIRSLTERRHRDPASVLLRVTELMADSEDPRVEAAGRLAAGLALQEVGRIRDAVASFRRGVETSVSHGLNDQEVLGRAQLAVALLNLGEATNAEQEITRARAVAPKSVRGVVEMLWGLILLRTGRLDDAMAAYRQSLRWLAQVGDEVSMGRVRINRGLVLAYQGELDAALDDFVFAERVAVEHQLPAMAAMAAHNIGFTHGRRGSLPDALAAFERAEQAYCALETPHRFLAVLQADRCHVLLLAGLVHDARTAAEAAVAALEQVDEVQLSEARLLLARTLLADGAYDRAATEATTAARSFQTLRRGPWAAQARYVAIQAEVLALQDQGLPPPEMLRRGRRIATELEAQGWPVEALHVRTFVARMALALGRPALARTELAQAAAARFRGTADLRAQAWHAAALLRLADGDNAGAKRALSRGIAVVDEYRSTLGASELRANAASHVSDLARLGIQLALADGRPAEVLRWADRCRAGAMHQVTVRPPPDESLAAALAELRRVRAELREASLGGDDSPEAVARAAALEESVRNRTRQVRQDRTGEAGRIDVGRIDVGVLRRALGSRALVEYVTHEERLYAVTIVRRRVRLRELGDTAPVAQEKAYLMFALRRLLLGRTRGLGADVLAPTAARLDELLLAPLGLDVGAPVVVVPTGLLHGLPWSCLPSLAGRDATIAPSAALWLRDAGRSPTHAHHGHIDPRRPAGRPGRRAPAAGRRGRGPGAGLPLPRGRGPGRPGGHHGQRPGGHGTGRHRPPGRPRSLPGRQPAVLLSPAGRRPAHRLRRRAGPGRAPPRRSLRVRGRRRRREDRRRAARHRIRPARPGCGLGRGARLRRPRRRHHSPHGRLPPGAARRSHPGGGPGSGSRRAGPGGGRRLLMHRPQRRGTGLAAGLTERAACVPAASGAGSYDGARDGTGRADSGRPRPGRPQG